MILTFFILILFPNYLSSSVCKKLDQYCFCDETCSSFGDCCPDHVNFDQNENSSNLTYCKPISYSLQTRIFNKCPDSEHRLSNFCNKATLIPDNHLKSLIPVITKGGEIYENLFCAQCNGKNKFQFLNITFYCVEDQPKSVKEINKLLKNKSPCSISVSFPKKIIRPCIEKLVRKCPKDFDGNINKTVVDYCENKITNNTIVYKNGDNYYRNEYCCNCWNVTCYPFGVESQPTVAGFSYLLNFNEWEQEYQKIRSNATKTNNQSLPDENIGIYYISFVFTILSIISLLILIGIYLTQKIFHSFGGYLTICLGSCLLLLNILGLFLSKEIVAAIKICKLIAVLKHYVALSTFMWMGIYALDLMQTFGFGSTDRCQKKTMKTLFIYGVIGFGIVTGIVGSAFVIENSSIENSTIRPDYGGESCWFTSKLGGIIWYFIPVCFLLTWNFIACLIVFYKISKTAKECRAVQNSDSNNTFVLCFRLTAVFGIGYLFQIIAVFTKVQGLIMVGSMMNCLQGCFLASCFLCTKRVRNVVITTFTSMSIRATSNTNTQNPIMRGTLISNTKL